ncbi:MAG: hypothetical protein N2444_02145 [Methylocystis sp.]|nr:hypothetical protein [Methylocystis sp.]
MSAAQERMNAREPGTGDLEATAAIVARIAAGAVVRAILRSGGGRQNRHRARDEGEGAATVRWRGKDWVTHAERLGE